MSHPHPPPSAFSRNPSLTRLNTSGLNARDSLSTQVSGISSSVYPPSTLTASRPESPLSPRSMVEQTETYDARYDAGEIQEYDGDDVSYRLQLLMKNNYFLPPAHSKPSPAELAPASPNVHPPSKKLARAITPTFLDLFRGKSKSKSSAQTPAGDSPPPALRTAADSIAPSYTFQPRFSSPAPRIPTRPDIRTGRVVVVREKMHDLSVAAKQAETDMKSRGVWREQLSPSSPNMIDVIDPTDSVDVPLPSSTYPFAVQASALHGLGVHESVGAALLADRLPPPRSPGRSSSNDEEDWRKALLHQAVHHSLDGTSQDFSPIRRSPTPLTSPRPGSATTPASSPPIGKPILAQHMLDKAAFSDDSPPPLNKKGSNYSLNSSTQRDRNGTLVPPGVFRQSFLPMRAVTPVSPLNPLTPPPRKFLINPLHTLSQTELSRSDSQTPTKVSETRHSLRKAMSSPVLSETYEERRHAVLTPPPLPTPIRSSFRDIAGSPSFDGLSQHTSDSHFSDDMACEDRRARASFALSAINGRASVSDYSQPSASPSSYDLLNHSLGSSRQPSGQPSIDQEASPGDGHVPRHSAVSPPPRISSSLANVALLPPPRKSSLHYPSQASGNTHITEPCTDDTTLLIVAPGPASPGFSSFPPLSERRGISATRDLSLDIPPTNIPVAIHSAPGPSSPTSFFDTLQSQPNAMDDLDSSDSEDGDDETYRHPLGLVHPYADPLSPNVSPPSGGPRPSMTRLGNHSTPHVDKTVRAASFELPSQRQPIGNTAVRTPFFSERLGRSDQGHGLPVSTLDFHRFVQQHRPGGRAGMRRSTVGSAAPWGKNPKAEESSRKLDGILIQHMEAEKDRMRRIASTVRLNRPVDSRA